MHTPTYVYICTYVYTGVDGWTLSYEEFALGLKSLPYFPPVVISGLLICALRWYGAAMISRLLKKVSFAEYSLFHRAFWQKSPIFLGSLLIVATSYHHSNPCNLLFLSVYVSASVSASLRVSAFRFCVLCEMCCLCWSLHTDLFWFWFAYVRIHKESSF